MLALQTLIGPVIGLLDKFIGDSNRANTKLVMGIIIKFDAMPRTHTHPTAGRHPATNKEDDAASVLFTAN